MALTLEFFSEPASFLAAVGEHLAGQPVVSTVVSTIAERARGDREAGVPAPTGYPYWFVAVRDVSGDVVGAGMRTAHFVPHPMFLLPMPDEAAVALARAVVERGEELDGVNGALPAARLCAEEAARLTSRTAVVELHTWLFDLTTLVDARPAPGRIRLARPDEVDLGMAWFEAFMGDADEQAGRERGVGAHESPSRDDVERRIQEERLWFWEDDVGEPVSLVSANPAALGIARVGPVYTPADRRGRGYASACVAEVSRQILAAGDKPCLFTDQANPTSNKIYETLGYRRVVDMANVVVVARDHPTAGSGARPA